MVDGTYSEKMRGTRLWTGSFPDVDFNKKTDYGTLDRVQNALTPFKMQPSSTELFIAFQELHS